MVMPSGLAVDSLSYITNIRSFWQIYKNILYISSLYIQGSTPTAFWKSSLTNSIVSSMWGNGSPLLKVTMIRSDKVILLTPAFCVGEIWPPPPHSFTFDLDIFPF